MSARDRLLDRNDPEWDRVVDEILSEHRDEVLSEAAELQRTRMSELDLTAREARVMWRIIDLIDPEAIS